MANLVNKSTFSKMCGVHASAITKALKHSLGQALIGKKIDTDHPIAAAYITHNRGKSTKLSDANDPKPLPPKPPPIAPRTIQPSIPKVPTNTSVPPALNAEHLVEYPNDIKDVLSWTGLEIFERFHSTTQYNAWLKAAQTIEAIEEKNIKNAKARGDLVSRDLMKRGVIDPIESAHMKLLTDGAKTIASRVIAMKAAERSIPDIEAAIVDLVGSFIKPMKKKIVETMESIQSV